MFATASIPNTAAAINTAMSRVYGLMGLGLLITALVAFFTAASPFMMAAIFGTSLKWVVLLSPLLIVFAMSFGYEKFSKTTLLAAFLTFSGLMGLSMAVLPHVYTMGSLASVFFITAGLFGAMSAWGYFTKKDLTSWGSLLFWALIGLIVAMIVNIFLGSGVLNTIISMVAVIVFLGLTAYDTQKIREMLQSGQDVAKGTIMGALSLYLDFINLFIHLLQLVGIKKD